MNEPVPAAAGGAPQADAVGAALVLAVQEYLIAIETRKVVAFPPVRRALVLGPHPDDAVLGCGGTLVLLRDAGVDVRLLCLTDGRACVAAPAERAAIATLRAAEEREGGRRCGVEHVELLAFPEDRVQQPDVAAALVAALRERLQALRPDALFVPHWLELHPIHRLVNAYLARALDGAGLDGHATVYAYEVASLVPPALVVDTSAAFERKKHAIGAYVSQLRLRDYVADSTLLARVHAPLAGPAATAAEVFLPLPAAEYRARVAALALDRPATLHAGIQPMVPEASG